jgi:hypothetical protein
MPNAVPPSDVCPFSPAACIVTLTSKLNPTLTAGSTYWLRADAEAASHSAYVWLLASQDGFTGSWVDSARMAISADIFQMTRCLPSRRLWTRPTLLLPRRSRARPCCYSPGAPS